MNTTGNACLVAVLGLNQTKLKNGTCGELSAVEYARIRRPIRREYWANTWLLLATFEYVNTGIHATGIHATGITTNKLI